MITIPAGVVPEVFSTILKVNVATLAGVAFTRIVAVPPAQVGVETESTSI